MSKKLLIICHVMQPAIGNIRQLLPHLGIEYDVHLAAQYEPYPDVNDYDGLMVMGGPQGVYDIKNEDWFKAEEKFIQQMIDAGKSVLGICLGCQILAHMHGGQVYKSDKGLLVGFSKIKVVKDDPIFKRDICGIPVTSWQQDSYKLRGGERLAEGDFYIEQAAKFGDKVYGLQFHPETTPNRLRHLHSFYADMNDEYPRNFDIEGMVEELEKSRPKVEAWFEAFLGRLFLA